METKKQQSVSRRALFVDLDGTLVATDLLWESVLLAIKRQVRVLFMLPVWVCRGRASLKRALAERVIPDPTQLPYCEDLLQFLQEERAHGRTVVLATASDRLWAQKVAEHLGVFDDVLASDGLQNLKGLRKLEAIEAYCQEYDIPEFAYVGNAHADLPIWRRAAQIYAVKPSASLLRMLATFRKPLHVFGHRRSWIGAAIHVLHPQSRSAIRNEPC